MITFEEKGMGGDEARRRKRMGETVDRVCEDGLLEQQIRRRRLRDAGVGDRDHERENRRESEWGRTGDRGR